MVVKEILAKGVSASTVLKFRETNYIGELVICRTLQYISGVGCQLRFIREGMYGPTEPLVATFVVEQTVAFLRTPSYYSFH